MWNLSSSLLYMNCWPPSPSVVSIVPLSSPACCTWLWCSSALVWNPGAPWAPHRHLASHGHGWACHYGLTGNLCFDSLGKGKHYTVSPDTCGHRQCSREVRLSFCLGHGWFGAANQGSPPCLDRPVPGWASGQRQDRHEPPGPRQVIRGLLLHWFRFLMG